jgi:alkylation response protein AidB-like acyl-CoA dehydrogenase
MQALPTRRAELLRTLRALVAPMQSRAAEHDSGARFPGDDIAALRKAGLLAAPMPEQCGGLGLGTEPAGAETLAEALRLCGQGNLAVARLFEAHVNALRLIFRYGPREAAQAAASDAAAGHLFGLWVTDPPGAEPLAAERDILRGRKGPCSGAGHCTRALVTAATLDGVRMAAITLSGRETVLPLAGLQGMRAAANGTVVLDGIRVDHWIGWPGDYLREPDFSCGAWRASAAAAGGLDALVEAVRADLRRTARAPAPLQQARFGALLIAQETCRLWTARAAAIAESDAEDPAAQVAYVNLARLAIERACLDALTLAQRSLGLAAFIAPNPVERIARDLGTYLRQPAPDAVLLEAAAFHLGC